MYFPQGSDLYAADPILRFVEQRPRVARLIAHKTAPGYYHFDIRVQGLGETVFMDI